MVFENTTFGTQLDILHRSMDVSVMRNSVIANNLANADTPNFKRSVVNFESQLAYALEQEQKRPRFQAALTNERHIPFDRTPDYRDVKPRRVLDFTTTGKNNNNNVDVEVESMNLLNNQMAYQMMTRSVADSMARLNLVLS